MSPRLPRGASRTAGFAFVIGYLALISNPAAANVGESPSLRDRARRLAEATLAHRCLTPAIDGVFNQAVSSGAFQAALGTTYAITHASARDGRIELTVAKPGGRAHTVTLALERIVGRAPDGSAGDFIFYLQPGADAESSRVVLEVARVLAERIPDTALAPCQSREGAFGTRAVALLTAALAVLIVVAALLFGFRKLRHVSVALPLLLALGFPFGTAPAGAQSIPPGEEELLAAMLGNGAKLPGGCAFADGQVDRDVVRATYQCSYGEVRIQLSHPTAPGVPALVTRRFALTVVDGAPQRDLLGAIETLIRSRESEFDWSLVDVEKDRRGLAAVLGLPRWFFALLLLALTTASSISAARAWATGAPVARRAALEALIVAATVVIWLQIKAEPPAHGDTAVDVALARDCIGSKGALCLGHAASAIGLVQGQAFTYALAAWLYLGLSMRALCFVAACVLGAASGLLHYAIARRFGGLAWLVSTFTPALAVIMTGYPAMWNPSWFVLPLTAAFLATLAIAGGSGMWSAFVAGAAFAITAESHVLFGTFVAVAALIVLLTAPRPVVAATILLSSFVVTEIAISPLSSAVNTVVLRSWVAAHPVPAVLAAVLLIASVPIQLRLRRAIRSNPDRREPVAALVWLLAGAVGIGMVLPWAVSRPPQVRYLGAAFPAIGYAGAWLLNAATSRARSSIAGLLAIVIFAAVFANRMRTADFARPGWFMDDGREVATTAGLVDTSALDMFLIIRPMPDGALREAAAAFAGTADAPRFPSRIIRAVRPQPHVELPEGWTRIRVARGQIFTSEIDAWTHPEEAGICPDPPTADPCMTLTRDDFTDVARDADGVLHRVFGLRIARTATEIGAWTRRGARSLLWRIPLHAAGPDDARDIVLHEVEAEIVAVEGTRWTARSDNHAVVERPPPGSAASMTVRTPVAGKFEAGVPPMPFELRQAELGLLQDNPAAPKRD